MIWLARRSRSPQIVLAAEILTATWVCGLGAYAIAVKLADTSALTGLLALIDLSAALLFFRASRGRWFPVPLYFLHVAMGGHHALAALFELRGWHWIALITNRFFELGVLYVMGAAIFRLMPAGPPVQRPHGPAKDRPNLFLSDMNRAASGGVVPMSTRG